MTSKRIKILYRKNLKMSPGKIAAQAVHAALGFNEASIVFGTGEVVESNTSVVVLGVSDKKFADMKKLHSYAGVLVRDAGYTEVEPGTETVLAFLEDDPGREDAANGN